MDRDELESLAGCISYVLGSDDAVPEDTEIRLRQWLSGRNSGLIQTTPADDFAWPGHFFGRRRATGTWSVLFGAPPGIVHDPDGLNPAFQSLVEAFDSLAFLVPYELGRVDRLPSPGVGVVQFIAVADAAEAPMRTVERVDAVAGRGLVGDRYEKLAGTFTDTRGRGNDLTLVESESLMELHDSGVQLSPQDARRNIVTENVTLDALIGKKFRIGNVECFGQRRCEPCAHLERLTKPGILRGLVHRGGLRADILVGGNISVGDVVEVLPEM